MKKLAIVPARAGSKRLPNKNMLKIGGKTLIHHAVDHALESDLFDNVVVTTDIQGLSFDGAIVYRRPDYLCEDDSSSVDVVVDVVNTFNRYDYICLLQPTSPLRTANDIINAFKMFDKYTDAIISFSDSLDVNGAIYWIKTDALLDNMSLFPEMSLPYLMPNDRSIDIDTKEDYEKAVKYYDNKRNE